MSDQATFEHTDMFSLNCSKELEDLHVPCGEHNDHVTPCVDSTECTLRVLSLCSKHRARSSAIALVYSSVCTHDPTSVHLEPAVPEYVSVTLDVAVGRFFLLFGVTMSH